MNVFPSSVPFLMHLGLVYPVHLEFVILEAQAAGNPSDLWSGRDDDISNLSISGGRWDISGGRWDISGGRWDIRGQQGAAVDSRGQPRKALGHKESSVHGLAPTLVVHASTGPPVHPPTLRTPLPTYMLWLNSLCDVNVLWDWGDDR